MQKVLNHVSDRSSRLTGKRRKNFQRSVRGGYSSTLSYDVIHGVFLFCLHLLKWKRKWSGWILWSQIKVECYFTFCILIRSQTELSVWDYSLRLCSRWKIKWHSVQLSASLTITNVQQGSQSDSAPVYIHCPLVSHCVKSMRRPVPFRTAYSSSHLLFFKNSCQTQLRTKFIHIYIQYNAMVTNVSWAIMCKQGVIYKTLQ